ncbi:catalase [Ornithinimicrobium sp. F0845]|uniref:catalase n=1 Tax=Ornithinimicrobium sp. F0845 TaxID=2926412 RepID=UPI001FF39A76|nr:catalase [Ornithinimicrobium sp. F0845]MCK0112390.1 catalase [Ornithinimicrobium sp. F0845]
MGANDESERSSTEQLAEAASSAVRGAAETAKEVVNKVKDAVGGVTIPGAPGSEPPTVEEPTEPREPLPPKPEQRAPVPSSATGKPLPSAPDDVRSQAGAYLTTAQGLRLADTDHSLTAGPRGPVLLQDHHLREKIMHFDHERIPERVVHARGTGAHGTFRSYGTAGNITRAAFLGQDAETPVFVRFSTVVGFRGSADTVRDTRGFAVKFYTPEGNFDLVGNNIPVFFIQDAIKFPDVVHSVKPEPAREIPQAQSAHDTFWDFVSLHTEAQHHVMWQMSGRGIPYSFRTLEGFGVHTFRMVAADGGTTLVKFFWKPVLGAHSLVWEEAQLINGADPDFHRRDLYDAIEAGVFPEWELGIQTFPDTPDQTFAGIDLLDPTKIVPEELAPVQPIGRLTLDGAPTNFFSEVEQVAFHPGHLVPGIDVTNDPLLQGRLFSYLDTQLTRLGGPNFSQIPVNRPHAPVNDMFRDGFHQHAVHAGNAPYQPNSIDGGCPFAVGAEGGGYVEVPEPVEGAKERRAPESFADHFTQPRLFWVSMTPVEQQQIADAYTFELGKCYEQAIKERQLMCLANIDPVLCRQVAQGLGLPGPEPSLPLAEVAPSPALSQIGRTWPTDGRRIGIVADESSDLDRVRELRSAIHAAGMTPLVIAPHGGMLGQTSDSPFPVQRSFLTGRSVEVDAVLLAGAPAPAPPTTPAADARAAGSDALTEATEATVDPRVTMLVAEAFRHAKPIGAWGAGATVLDQAGVSGPGVVIADSATEALTRVQELLGGHRVWDRFPAAHAVPEGRA